MSETFYYKAPWGRLIVTIEDDQLSCIDFVTEETKSRSPFSADIKDNPGESQTAQKICKQLDEYFAGSRQIFDVPLLLRGSPFQKEVWKALQQIPYATTLSYSKVALAIGRPKVQRAVGMACNRNPVPIIVPCHRVLGSSGQLTGYAGGLDIKAHLLELEKNNKE